MVQLANLYLTVLTFVKTNVPIRGLSVQAVCSRLAESEDAPERRRQRGEPRFAGLTVEEVGHAVRPGPRQRLRWTCLYTACSLQPNNAAISFTLNTISWSSCLTLEGGLPYHPGPPILSHPNTLILRSSLGAQSCHHRPSLHPLPASRSCPLFLFPYLSPTATPAQLG